MLANHASSIIHPTHFAVHLTNVQSSDMTINLSTHQNIPSTINRLTKENPQALKPSNSGVSEPLSGVGLP